MTLPATHRYRIHVAGHLDDHWSARLGDHRLTRHADGTTTITTDPVDQAGLHGTLTAIGDIGASLLGVQIAPDGASKPSLSRLLTTDRLVLRSASADDAAPTWRYRRLAEVNRWLDGPLPDFEAYAERFTDPERLASTVIVEGRRNSSGDAAESVIGDFMLRRSDAWAQAEVAAQGRGALAELGWALDPGAQGQGYATEAASALLLHSFSELGVHRVTAECFLGNEASWRLMERIGMRRESRARRDALHRSGRWLDSVTYAAVGDEWLLDRLRVPPASRTSPTPKEHP